MLVQRSSRFCRHQAGSPSLPLALAIGLLASLSLYAPPSLQAQPAAAVPATEISPTKEQAPAKEQASKPGDDWVRILKDDDGQPIAMQTAVVRYQSKPVEGKKPVVVDLVGAIHVGDAAYYQDLNRRFEAYDALLYELVAPEGTRIQPSTKSSSRHPLDGMKSMLELEHQLEIIDYTKPNFVHADMSPDQFFESMKGRGEGLVQMYFRMMGQAIAHQSKMTAKGATPDIDLFRAMMAKDRARQLKITMAKQMDQMESLLTSFGGEQGSTIITERNKTALKVLREQLDAGKSPIGIFYGAGHLTDMGERLRKEFDLHPTEVTWLTAWDLAEKKKP